MKEKLKVALIPLPKDIMMIETIPPHFENSKSYFFFIFVINKTNKKKKKFF